MRKTRWLGAILLGAAACTGTVAETLGDAMVDAGRVLQDGGSALRDAMGEGAAQATEAGLDAQQLVDAELVEADVGVQLDAVADSPPDSGDQPDSNDEDAATDVLHKAVFSGACSTVGRTERTYDSDPDITSNTEDYFAEFDVPGLDPDDPPVLQARHCDTTFYGDGVDSVSGPPSCPQGYTCQYTGARPPPGCQWAGVVRLAPGKAWVNCGYRTITTDSSGSVTADFGYRGGTAQLVVLQ